MFHTCECSCFFGIGMALAWLEEVGMQSTCTLRRHQIVYNPDKAKKQNISKELALLVVSEAVKCNNRPHWQCCLLSSTGVLAVVLMASEESFIIIWKGTGEEGQSRLCTDQLHLRVPLHNFNFVTTNDHINDVITDYKPKGTVYFYSAQQSHEQLWLTVSVISTLTLEATFTQHSTSLSNQHLFNIPYDVLDPLPATVYNVKVWQIWIFSRTKIISDPHFYHLLVKMKCQEGTLIPAQDLKTGKTR